MEVEKSNQILVMKGTLEDLVREKQALLPLFNIEGL
jgi:hypothetical protein